MKLDPTVMRTMNAHDFKVLEAVEKGMKNHALVPLPLVNSIANLRHGGTHKIVSSLLRDKLLSHERKTKGRGAGVDGYRLTNAGYDILALHHLKARGFIAALGQRIGTGKESDIYLAATPEGKQIVLKFHRLGRTSFRNVKKKRDYFGKAAQQAHSWLFLSRLSALKEFAFMKALYDVNYPTPTPVAHNRHIVAMSLVRGIPLYQIFPKQLSVQQAADIYDQAVRLAARLASKHGLVHCDLNEFNLLVDLSGIQSIATTDEADPYVRHSGMSVHAGDKSVGALSKPAWEQSLETQDDIVPPRPVALLENGQPKPVVTLIDFPQMISTKHPNAQELYQRDLACLRRFFELKLYCTIPDEYDDRVQWDAIMKEQLGGGLDDDDDNDPEKRLDSELKASGFSAAMGRGLELYYFDTGVGGTVAPALQEEDEVDEDEQDEDSQVDDQSSEENQAENKDKGSSDTDGEHDDDDEISPQDANKDLDGGSDDENNNNNDPDNDDIADDVTNATASVQIVDTEELESLARDKVLERAKERVRKQLEEERRKSRRKGAFKKGNKNKTYIKGKRVMQESGF